jgi:hypothetical protein
MPLRVRECKSVRTEIVVAAKPPIETVALWSARDGFSYSPDAAHAVLGELDG